MFTKQFHFLLLPYEMIYHTPIIFPTAAEYVEYFTSCLLFVFKVTGTLQLGTVQPATATPRLQLQFETGQRDPRLDENR